MRVPFGIGKSLRRVEDGNGSCLVAITTLFIARNDVDRASFRAVSLDRVQEGRLVFLELNDQLRFGCGSGFESFFDNA